MSYQRGFARFIAALMVTGHAVTALAADPPPPLERPIFDLTCPADSQELCPVFPLVSSNATNNLDPFARAGRSELAHYITDQVLGLQYNGPSWAYNWGGLNEEWMVGSGSRQYFITPNGQLTLWQSGTKPPTGQVVASLSPFFYYYPALLTNSTATPLHALVDSALGLTGQSTSLDATGKRWILASGPEWYYLTSSGELVRWVTGWTVATIAPVFWEHPERLYNSTSLPMEFVLDELFNLNFTTVIPQGYGGKNERWFQGTAGSGAVFYFITPGGAFFRWDGTPNSASGKFLAALPKAFYENPALLASPQPFSPATIQQNEALSKSNHCSCDCPPDEVHDASGACVVRPPTIKAPTPTPTPLPRGKRAFLQ